MAGRLLPFNHERMEDDLSAYIDNELPAGARRRLERHLNECASCAAALVELQAVSWATSRLPEEAPPRSCALTPALLEERSLGPRTRALGAGGFRPPWQVLGLVAASLAALAIGAGAARLLTQSGSGAQKSSATQVAAARASSFSQGTVTAANAAAIPSETAATAAAASATEQPSATPEPGTATPAAGTAGLGGRALSAGAATAARRI